MIADSKKNPEKYEDDKMFVLIIMGHGGEDRVYDPEIGYLHLSDVYKKLSHKNFKVMKGKPKWVIIQACKGRGMSSTVYHSSLCHQAQYFVFMTQSCVE